MFPLFFGQAAIFTGADDMGRTLLQTQSPTGTGTVTFSAISGTYKKLIVEAAMRSTQAAAPAVDLTIKLNNDGTAGNYRKAITYVHSSGTAGAAAAANGILATFVPAADAPASDFAILRLEIPFYANTAFFKHVLGQLSMAYDASAVFMQSAVFSVDWHNANAITQIDLLLSAGNFATGSVINLYGEN
jgi:hypothetical protein